MPEKPSKFYLTTPIYYVNARPHIGHAYTTIAADVLARRHRLLGEDVFFLTGTDEHGQKIERSAAAAGVPPQQFADEVAASFENLWKRMGTTNDKFIRTTSAEHKRGVQKLWCELESRGAIYLDSYTGAYCVSDETFVDLPAGTPCPDCGRPLEIVTEENYFFKLSDYQQRLIDLIESGELSVEPEARRNEVLSFVRGGLKDLSISRTSFQWGIPVPPPANNSPGAPSMERSDMGGKEKSPQSDHVIYVWLDALANYITAVGYGSDAPEDIASFAKWWPADLHLVGKEIIRFHCVYWPAFLLAAGIALPKKIQAHGWLLFEESKMSKSRGNIVRTETILDAFGDHYRSSIAAHNKNLEADTSKVEPGTANQQKKSAVILSEARRAESKEPDTAHAATAARSSLTRQPALLKGTASAVPSADPQTSAALAAEVTPFIPEPTKEDCDLFAADVLRYFLLREIPFGQDGSFSFDALITRYNADLANGYGNLVSRTLSMIEKYCGGVIPKNVDAFSEDVAGAACMAQAQLIGGHFERIEMEQLTKTISSLIATTDGYITYRAPWKMAAAIPSDTRAIEQTLYVAAEHIRIITALLHPVMPHTTAKVWAQLGLGDIEEAARNGKLKELKWGGLQPGTRLGPLAPIFPRAPKELAQIMTDMEAQNNPPKVAAETETPKYGDSGASLQNDARGAGAPQSSDGGPKYGDSSLASRDQNDKPSVATENEQRTTDNVSGAEPRTPNLKSGTSTISIDDFAKVDLRVARVLVAERIPKADKLLRLEVDLGPNFNPPTRQILAGIAQFYEPEKLIGRKVVIVANLAPRKMRGLESQGMVVAASAGPDGAPVLAGFLEDVEIGARLK